MKCLCVFVIVAICLFHICLAAVGEPSPAEDQSQSLSSGGVIADEKKTEKRGIYGFGYGHHHGGYGYGGYGHGGYGDFGYGSPYYGGYGYVAHASPYYGHHGYYPYHHHGHYGFY
ncbi:keratin-associated protein 19-2 [Drosophila tropicalis]|uniref:keratin-associated protein 19-2 n=1 Tax=Drosophila tropicalis TaxID=46794 RepID=UPI0035AC0E6E